MSNRRAALIAALAFLAGPGPALAQTGDPSFNLVNRSGRQIYEAYASATTENNWGPDRLGANVLPNGQSFPVRLPPGVCTTDIRVVYEGGQAEERRNVNTCQLTDVVFGDQAAGPQPGGKGQAAAPRGEVVNNPSFHLVNNSGRMVREFYASPTTDNNWGPDRLGQEMVPAGRTFAIRLPAGECVYDMRVVYDNGQAQERRRVNLCEVVTVPLPW